MTTLKLPKPTSEKIQDLKTDIERGKIKMPLFQRNFVWDVGKTAKLLDSILKGYPIGTFIFWTTADRLRSIKNLGGIDFPEAKKNEPISYVLDGQQRITSIYACLKGLTLDSNEIDYSQVYVNLLAKDEESIVVSDVENLDIDNCISFSDFCGVITGTVKSSELAKRFSADIFDHLCDLQTQFQNYEFAIVEIEDAPIDIATEIFTRINVSGKPLSIFEIMCAKIYIDNKFDLSEEYLTLKESLEKKGFETLSTSTIMQTISVCLKKSCKNKDILTIDKTTFCNSWPKVIKSLNKAIDHLKLNYGVAASKMLPYDSLIVPFTYYFFKNGNKKITSENTKKQLKDYFWRCVMCQRFTEGVTSKLQNDIQFIIDPILKNKLPKIEDSFKTGVNISTSFLSQKGEFTTGSAIAKGILCLLALQKPLCFKDGSNVVISNEWLSQSNSKNYHHFFPKKYMKKYHPEVEFKKVNHIANITIFDDETNKEISSKKPAKYIKDYENTQGFKKILKSHLINDLDTFGIKSDNYQMFFEKRLCEYNKILKKMIIIRNNFDITK